MDTFTMALRWAKVSLGARPVRVAAPGIAAAPAAPAAEAPVDSMSVAAPAATPSARNVRRDNIHGVAPSIRWVIRRLLTRDAPTRDAVTPSR
jgi:hypothetical protein